MLQGQGKGKGKGTGKGKGKGVPGWVPASAAVHLAGSAHCFVVCLAAEVPDPQRLGIPCWLSGEAQCEAWHLVLPMHHKLRVATHTWTALIAQGAYMLRASLMQNL